ncbi:MAG: RNA polymerase sigma factor [Sandaracinaceae bacterium]
MSEPAEDDEPERVEALVDRAREGDEAALGALLREMVPTLRRRLQRLLGPRPSLDDATQDVLVAIARGVEGFRGESRFETWCHRICIRVARRHMHRERPRPVLALVPDADAVDPEARAIARQRLERLYAALDELEPDARVAFVLCAIEGHDPSEAAALCDVSAGTMRVRLHRARKRVEERLDADGRLR